MARAYGANATLLLKRETTYGVQPSGNFVKMPFNKCSLGSEQGLIDDPLLGQGRDPLAPLRDVINDAGEIVIPVDLRYLGIWLTGVLGDPTTTGTGPYTHAFGSGAADIPSYSIEVGFSQVPAFFMHKGVKFDSVALEFQRSGAAAATVHAIAQGETRNSSSQGGTPTALTFTLSSFPLGTECGHRHEN
ncbi:MAG: hypothetical protein HQL76_18105 [Magnetococcales bacterium]|nr:hypothetical protein [Magnetococcales bacterium]